MDVYVLGFNRKEPFVFVVDGIFVKLLGHLELIFTRVHYPIGSWIHEVNKFIEWFKTARIPVAAMTETVYLKDKMLFWGYTV